MMKKRMTIDDVAREAGVSRQTVSRAINNMDGISPITRDRVMDAVAALGYRPSRLAKGMASNLTHTIGLIVSNITNPAIADIVRGLQDVAQAENYNVFLRNTDNVIQQEVEALRSLIAENVDGVVILSSQIDDDVITSFASSDLPIVLVHRTITAPYVSSIVTDVTRAAKTVMEYLFGAGHENIGLLTRLGDLNTIDHVLGYKLAYASRKQDSVSQWIIQAAPSLTGGYQAAQRLLNQHPNLTALIAYNDLMAIGAMKACAELGRPVPDSVAVFGYNDIAFAAYAAPPLSTVRVHGYDVGRCAMGRLLEMRAHPEVTFPSIVFDIELVFRESTTVF